MDQADSVLSTPPTNTSSDTPVERTAESAGGLYYKTPVSPEEAFQAIGRLRKEARDEIDRLIRFLDETENHMEREPDDEGDDAELEEDDPGEDEGICEPSLGSLDHAHHPNQERWGAGSRSDRELDGAESGIGDADGLHEQVGTQDWQQGSMG